MDEDVPAEVARQAIDLIRAHGLDAWVYRGNDWLITKPDAPHVAREAWTVKFEPKVVAEFATHLEVSRRSSASATTSKRSSAAKPTRRPRSASGRRRRRSQPYYLDVTNKDANKGAVVEYLSHHLDVPAARDRHHRRPAKRRADVQAIGLQHRDGQRVR